MATGINISKAHELAVLGVQKGINISKAHELAVLGVQKGINISKVVEYVVLSNEEFTSPPPSDLRITRYDISGNARHFYDEGTNPISSTAGKIGNAAYFKGA